MATLAAAAPGSVSLSEFKVEIEAQSGESVKVIFDVAKSDYYTGYEESKPLNNTELLNHAGSYALFAHETVAKCP